jgi:hypothetical protein
MNNYAFSQPTTFGMYSPFGSSNNGSAKPTTNIKPFATFGSAGSTFGSPPQKQANVEKAVVKQNSFTPSFASAFPNGFPNTFIGNKTAPVITEASPPLLQQQPVIEEVPDVQKNPKSQTFIRVWKQTPSDIISTNKILALLSSHFLNEDVDLFNVENLSYQLLNETKTMTTIAPLALLSFVDPSVAFNLPPLQIVFVKFLKELLKEDVVTTIEKAWKFVEDAARFMGMVKILEYISLMKTCKSSIPKQTTEVDDETAFVLALHYFLTNSSPKDAIIASRTFSKKVSKLTTDMVLASYGLEWLMKDKICDYIKKHQDSYKLLC